MPKIDLSLTITGIIALSAVLSPIVTAIINNRYLFKMKKLELDWQRYKDTSMYQRSVFEHYLQYAGRCIYFSDENAMKEYGEYYFLASLYIPNELREEMITINASMQIYDWKKAMAQFELFCPKLQAFLHTL